MTTITPKGYYNINQLVSLSYWEKIQKLEKMLLHRPPEPQIMQF